MQGFIRGDVSEVDISHVIATKPPKGIWTMPEKEAAAAAYEAEHPGVTVRRDWESDAQFAARKRRVKATAPAVERTLSMDPDRAKRELRRQYAGLQGLTPQHPDYRKLFTNAVEVIHQLEDICGIPRTDFEREGWAKKPDEKIPEELQKRINDYVKWPSKNRRAYVSVEKDEPFLKLIRDLEPEPEIQQLAVERLMEVGAL